MSTHRRALSSVYAASALPAYGKVKFNLTLGLLLFLYTTITRYILRTECMHMSRRFCDKDYLTDVDEVGNMTPTRDKISLAKNIYAIVMYTVVPRVKVRPNHKILNAY